MVLLLRENHLLRCRVWLSLLNWIRALTLNLLLKLPPRKLESWFILRSFFLLRFLCISINIPYNCVWNTVIMSGLVPLVATWNCYISYKNRYGRLLVHHLQLLLDLWFIVEMYLEILGYQNTALSKYWVGIQQGQSYHMGRRCLRPFNEYFVCWH